jgi:DNA-binding PadR family transcriptional regulator
MGVDDDWPIKRFLPLRPVEFEVLLSLATGERHGFGIIQDAAARGSTTVLETATLYRALRRMQKHGLIGASERREEPWTGDTRRYYRHITPLGLRVARAEAQRLVALTHTAVASGLIPEVAA